MELVCAADLRPLPYDFVKNLRVVLVHPKEYYKIGPSNPAVDTEYECEGQITRVGESDIEVLWENKTANIYCDNELAYVRLSDQGRCVTIW